jgi:hypothetical protein
VSPSARADEDQAVNARVNCFFCVTHIAAAIMPSISSFGPMADERRHGRLVLLVASLFVAMLQQRVAAVWLMSTLFQWSDCDPPIGLSLPL